MKNLVSFFVVIILTAQPGFPHGLGGDLYPAEDEREVAPDGQAAPEKSFTKPIDARHRWWRASLTTGWTSREMHYGVDETGDFGAYTTELGSCASRGSL